MDVIHHRQIGLMEDELVSSLAWFVKIRWMAGLGVLVVSWIATALLALSLPAVPLYLVGLGVLVYNSAFWFVLRQLQKNPQSPIRAYLGLAQTQVGLDYLTMTLLIHLTGGLESPALLYFFFHIVISAILLSPQLTYVFTLAAILLVTGVALSEYVDLIPHIHVVEFAPGEMSRSPIYLLGELFFFVSTAAVVAYLAVTLNQRLRANTSRIIDLTNRLQDSYTHMQLLYDGAQAVNSTLDINQVLERLMRGTAQAMGVNECAVFLLDESKTRLTLAACNGLSDGYANKGGLILEKNPLAREVLQGTVISIGNVRTDSRLQYPTEAITEGIQSILSAPLIGKNGPLGLIRAYSSQADYFSKSDSDFFSAIASYGSIAIENAMAYQALSKLDELKSKFILTVTHELRSPLSVVRSLLRTMMAGYAGILSSEQKDIVSRTLHRTDSLQALIDDLLDLAAGKADLKVRQQNVTVSLTDAVKHANSRFQVMAQEKELALDLQTDSPDQDITIRATSDGVDRILNNLIANAIKYTPRRGKIMVTCHQSEHEACITIADTGIGIPSESVMHVFEEFYRAPNAKSLEKEGTGLGLAIVHDLVTRFGGHITVQSQIDQGTVFALTFPRES